MKKVMLVLVFLSWTVNSDAIVNIEKMRKDPSKEGFSGHMELSFGGASGNTKKNGGYAGTRLQWRKDHIINFAVLRYAYGESAGNRDTNNSFFHARHIHQQTSWRADEIFVQGETDEFARLSYRGLIGGGERFALIRNPKGQSAFLGMGVYYAMERLEDTAGTTDGGRDEFFRLSTYFSYTHQINAQVSVISTTYYQPALEQFSDYRLLEEAGMGIKMSDRFMLNLSLDIIHDSKPPQTVNKTDIIYSTGLEYQF